MGAYGRANLSSCIYVCRLLLLKRSGEVLALGAFGHANILMFSGLTPCLKRTTRMSMSAVRNQKTLDILTSSLEENGGDRYLACKRAGCSVAFVTQWCRDDSVVEAAIAAAISSGIAVLESAALKRAVHGVKEPIYYLGNRVGSKRKYSDGLLETMLKARDPGTYGNKLEVNKNITVKTLSDGELDARIADLSAKLGITYQPLLDAEFTEVIEDAEFSDINLDDLL